jgi:hypothetical protein
MSQLPRRLALVGVLLGFVLMGMWWYVDRYNPFQLPTLEQAQSIGNYAAPKLYWFLKDAMFALCPGLFLQLFTMDASKTVTWLMWILAALLNGPVYYLVGLVTAAILKVRGH